MTDDIDDETKKRLSKEIALMKEMKLKNQLKGKESLKAFVKERCKELDDVTIDQIIEWLWINWFTDNIEYENEDN